MAGHAKTELVRTDDAEDLDRALERLDGRTLVVAGGDGSLHLAVQRLWDGGELGDATIGLVPMGTGNDFARGLDLPLDPLEAASAVATGEPRRLDVALGDDGEVEVGVDGTAVGGGAEPMVGVGNGKTIGGGTPLCPDAVTDDGLLDVVVVNATGPGSRVPLPQPCARAAT